VRKTLYLENWSQLGPSSLSSVPLTTHYRHGFEVTEPISISDIVEELYRSRGQVSLYRFAQFARMRYPHDLTLAAWTWWVLLQDSTFFKLHYPGGGVTGRPYVLDMYHITTGQTREEWLEDHPSQDTEMLRNPALWTIGIDSLKTQYHKLYVYQPHDHGYDNSCQDGRGHHRYVSSHGYSGDLRHIDPEELDRQANEQGINPCIFAVLHEWIITWL
jgi:hypothetical protein